MCARAWLLDTAFNVTEHLQLANPDTNHIFSAYLRRCVDGCAGYLADRMNRMTPISFSMPTDLTSLRIRGAVPVIGIFHGTHLASMGTVQGLISGISGLTARWGP
jgi:hypothetical protein